MYVYVYISFSNSAHACAYFILWRCALVRKCHHHNQCYKSLLIWVQRNCQCVPIRLHSVVVDIYRAFLSFALSNVHRNLLRWLFDAVQSVWVGEMLTIENREIMMKYFWISDNCTEISEIYWQNLTIRRKRSLP